MIEQLEPLCRGVAELTVLDIDKNAELQALYTADVPVLTIQGREICRHVLDRQALMTALRASSGGG